LEPVQQSPQPAATTPARPKAAKPQEPPPPQSLTEALLREIGALHVAMDEIRVELAQARLEADAAKRELAELHQFMLDNQQFGNDFQQYKAVKDAAERDARQKQAEEARQRREAEKAERESRRNAARSSRDQQNALANRVAEYRRQGFSHLGLDVYASRMAFYYNTKDVGGGAQIEYDALLGNYLTPIPPMTEIDYSKMTISGSVLNASEVVRNIGVAITFFDDSGNQVGHETVQVANARPNVPYPFTSKIDMALNRAFASSSTYVLYADPVE
jgi:hypothetical protein